MTTKIIMLNGVGSVGKSSTAKALQKITSKPFLHVQGDMFLDMLPVTMMGNPDGIIFESTLENGKPSVIIQMGPIMDRAMRGFRSAVAALAAQGNDLIVDDVMQGGLDQKYYQEQLSTFDVSFVGLFAPLEVLEQRERDRGDRMIGLARWQFERVHNGVVYDLELDTTTATLKESAHKIADAFSLL
jgi:chloramphenicol 3-O phosphotransferase